MQARISPSSRWKRPGKTLETKLEKLRSDERKDDVITFEQLGVDRLFVDESHFYKNLFLTTKMRNVAGLSTSEAQKSSDMFGKCRYLDEITGGAGRGVRHGHAREQFHDRTVHGHAVLAIQYPATEKADPLRLLGIHLWRDHHRHRACPGRYRVSGEDEICQVL